MVSQLSVGPEHYGAENSCTAQCQHHTYGDVMLLLRAPSYLFIPSTPRDTLLLRTGGQSRSKCGSRAGQLFKYRCIRTGYPRQRTTHESAAPCSDAECRRLGARRGHDGAPGPEKR